MSDGGPAIRISGEVFGELRTKQSFENDHLKFQFKWGEKKWAPRDRPETLRDSGLLYHVHAPPGQNGRTWARLIELQIQEHDVGDLYAVGSTIAVRAKPRQGTKPALYDDDPTGEWMFFAQSHGMSGRCVKQPDNWKPTGEWNTVELIAFRDDAIHIVNGKVVMRLKGPTRIDAELPTPVTSGAITLDRKVRRSSTATFKSDRSRRFRRSSRTSKEPDAQLVAAERAGRTAKARMANVVSVRTGFDGDALVEVERAAGAAGVPRASRPTSLRRWRRTPSSCAPGNGGQP